MRLYEGSTQAFIEDTVQNRIADQLTLSFENYYGRKANPSEVNSWSNSLNYLTNVLRQSNLMDNMIVIEYELPYSTKRIDVILFGKGTDENSNVIVLELKQWSDAEDCDIEGNVRTWVGGAKRLEPHPSYQVRGYHFLLRDFMEMFNDNSTELYSCVYCHNYPKKNEVLFRDKFKEVMTEFPLFAKEDFEDFGKYLKLKLSNGNGLEIFNRFVNSAIKPSKKLLEHTKQTINGNPAFTLIDEQITANNTIIDRSKKASKLKNKSVIIVKGGPGTGKSVIALNVLAELLSKGHKVYHATGSKAFTSTLRKIVGTRVASFFKYFNSFSTTMENDLDILICDEAHRIRKTSNSRYTKKELRTDTPQVEELIRVAKVSIFFIDDYQAVRPDEIGSSQLIKETATKMGVSEDEIFEFELKTQFRCSGSDGYLNWVDNTLNIRDTANRMLNKNEKMEFKIFDSPQELYDEIKRKNEEKKNSARMVAGFCWSWSNTKPDGTLVEDVVIGDFKMTWEAKDESTNLAPGVVKASLWAHDPDGVSQCGSIYTIQGFEFDYVGVIFGKDLVYDPINKVWKGIKSNSADSMAKRGATDEEFTRFVKNVYRVLLTRGMKGVYVHFLDKDTENYFKTRIEGYLN
jgi:hypothetical protein